MALDQTTMQFVQERDQLRKGTWLEEEDERLAYFVQLMGDKKWDSLAKASGLRRSGKSCRLRWLNYLRPNLKHGQISVEEEKIILQLQQKWGNKWSKIAQMLPGRTDNEIKNYWRTYLRKKVSQEVEVKKGKKESLCMNKKELSPKNHVINNNNKYHETPNHLHESSLDQVLGTKWDNSSEASVEFGLTNSPYENRLSSWLSEYSNHNDHRSEINYLNDSCRSIESSGSSYLECWTSDVYYSNTWDYSSSLWDMNYY